MQEEKCSHAWEMINLQPGFIITERCSHCSKISTYLTHEEKPPLEEHRDGEHFWNVVESAQTIRFDLICNECGSLIMLNELSGLMMCTACEEKCEVAKLMKKYEKDRTWIYVAFNFFPQDEKEQLTDEQISALEEYFNRRRKSSRSNIKIVSSELIADISKCYAEVIKDVGMLSLTPPEQ